MSRPLKFRAWDIDEERWLDADEYESILINPIQDRYGNGFDLVNSTHKKTNRKVEFVQFTGLTDKHGQEIYEGDVLKMKGAEIVGMGGDYEDFLYGDATSEIEFHEGAFCVVEPNSRTLIPIKECLDPKNTGEILGNKYEHPELLEAI